MNPLSDHPVPLSNSHDLQVKAFLHNVELVGCYRSSHPWKLLDFWVKSMCAASWGMIGKEGDFPYKNRMYF